jgi:hypothetical protein
MRRQRLVYTHVDLVIAIVSSSWDGGGGDSRTVFRPFNSPIRSSAVFVNMVGGIVAGPLVGPDNRSRTPSGRVGFRAFTVTVCDTNRH